MENLFKRIFIFFLPFLVASGQLLVANPVSAAVRCEIQYGGREVCVRTGELQIDKEVFNPQEKKFVDNLGLNDYKFAPGEEVTFKIKVKNVGDDTFGQVNVMDSLPSLLEYPGSPFFQIKDLTPQETEEREVKVKVVSQDKFPGNKSLVCLINTAEAAAKDQRDKDTAQLCLERKVLAAEKGAPTILPPTGPENWLLVLGGSLLSGIIGLYLIRFVKNF